MVSAEFAVTIVVAMAALMMGFHSKIQPRSQEEGQDIIESVSIEIEQASKTDVNLPGMVNWLLRSLVGVIYLKGPNLGHIISILGVMGIIISLVIETLSNPILIEGNVIYSMSITAISITGVWFLILFYRFGVGESI